MGLKRPLHEFEWKKGTSQADDIVDEERRARRGGGSGAARLWRAYIKKSAKFVSETEIWLAT